MIGVGRGGSDGETVESGARWALEGRAILCCVLGRGRDDTTQIVSSIHLLTGGLGEDWGESSVHGIHFIVGWFQGDIAESVGGLFERR